MNIDSISRTVPGTNQYASKRKFTNKAKAYIGIFIISLLLLASLVMAVNSFFETHRFVFQQAISVHFQTPIYIAKREKPSKEVIEVMKAQNSPLTPDQQYACDKFGSDCRTFLAIMKAESGNNQKAININSNGTVDFGCGQINSIHLKNIDTTNVNLLNCRDNIDVAYKIYKDWKGFGAWSSYASGAYKRYLY